MKFGPRALGILGEARSPAMQSLLNLKVKIPRIFPPFAPCLLRDDVSDCFELDEDSPYMLLVADVVERRRKPMTPEQQQLFGIEKLNVPRSEIPAVTHVDYSARIQTVDRETNPRYYALLSCFRQRTGWLLRLVIRADSVALKDQFREGPHAVVRVDQVSGVVGLDSYQLCNDGYRAMSYPFTSRTA